MKLNCRISRLSVAHLIMHLLLQGRRAARRADLEAGSFQPRAMDDLRAGEV
jgi:hypothetical protein